MLSRLAWLALVLFIGQQASPAAARSPTLAVVGWSEAIEGAVFDAFTAETGIGVTFDPLDEPDALEARLRAGGVDLVLVPAGLAEALAPSGTWLTLDRSRLPGASRLLPVMQRATEGIGAAGTQLMPFLWGGYALGVNEIQLEKAQGGPPVASWSMVMKPDLAARLKGCGIAWADAPEPGLALVLRTLALDPASLRPSDLNRAMDAMLRVRGSVRRIVPDGDIDALAAGDLCVYVGRSRDILRARKLAEEAGTSAPVRLLAPIEGGPIWLDVMAVPRQAPHPQEAMTLIDFLLRPDIAARNAEHGYGTSPVAGPAGKKAAAEEVKPYGDPLLAERMFTLPPRDMRQRQPVDRLWARFKASR